MRIRSWVRAIRSSFFGADTHRERCLGGKSAVVRHISPRTPPVFTFLGCWASRVGQLRARAPDLILRLGLCGVPDQVRDGFRPFADMADHGRQADKAAVEARPCPEQGAKCRRAAPDRPGGRALLQRLHTRMIVRCGGTINRRPHPLRRPPAVVRCPPFYARPRWDGVPLMLWRQRYSIILLTTPDPTVRPPSRMANRRPFSIAIGAISSTLNFRLSPGITISVPSGRATVPVTSVVRK